jgi:hypothetical protein
LKYLIVETFKKKYGLTQAQLNDLARRGVVKVIQSGYYGHSLAHPRAVLYDEAALTRALVKPDRPPMLVKRDPPQVTKGLRSVGPNADEESERLYRQHRRKNRRLYKT